jgi:hypothetical protein
MRRKLTTKEWLEVQQAIKDGVLIQVIERLMADEYERGQEDASDQ